MASISFDRAAEYYDATRTMEPEAFSRVIEMLAGELARAERCLEIGVGTGRVAIPLRQAGVPVFGVDLSSAMLRKLMEKEPLPVVEGDATRLPFPDATFDSGLASHVLHLIPSWQEAVSELVRVVRPGGSLLFDPGGRGLEWWKEVQERFSAEAGIEDRFPGLNEPEELDAAMSALGAKVRLLTTVISTETTTLEERIGSLEKGIYSFTWQLDEETRRRAAQVTRDWAEERFGALDEARVSEWPIAWRAYDLPG